MCYCYVGCSESNVQIGVAREWKAHKNFVPECVEGMKMHVVNSQKSMDMAVHAWASL